LTLDYKSKVLIISVISTLSIALGILLSSLLTSPALEEAPYTIDYKGLPVYFNEYYINNDNELIIDHYWIQQFSVWQEMNNTLTTPYVSIKGR